MNSDKTTMMINKIKRLMMTAALCAAALGASAQNGFNVPFSQFGIGSSELPFNLPMVTRMGGALYTMAGNNFVNPFNPASYGNIEPESFVFDMGVEVQLSTLRDNNAPELFDADGNLGYLLMAMPLTKWWKLSAGLMPYSTVSYESVMQQTSPSYNGGTVKTVYSGSGGVNQIFLGSAFNLLRSKGMRPNIQVGFNVNYLTGKIERSIAYTFLGNDTTYYLNSSRYKKTSVNNLTFDIGLQVRQPLGEKSALSLGVVYKPYLDMQVKDLAMIYTYLGSTLLDTVFPAAGADPEFQSRLERPQSLGVGISLEYDRQWRVALDATFADWQSMRYTEGMTPSIMGTSTARYERCSRYAVGVERMGNMDATSYWGRISWSFGAHLTQGALHLTVSGSDRSLNEHGFGAGATLPMRKGKSLLTLSAGYSSLGSVDVLQHNTVTFGIAVSSCERWFFKRKFN